MRHSLVSIQWWVCLFHCCILAIASETSSSAPLPTDEHGDYNGADLIEWINSHPQGDIHPSLRIGREIPGDATSLLGLFVSSSAAAIEKGDIIAQIPWDHMIHPDTKYKKSKFFSCRAIYNIAKELKLGDKSSRAPYVRYLLTQPRGIMPGEWTKAGQTFLSTILANGALPPYEDTWKSPHGLYDTEWIDECSGDEDDEVQTAAYWLASSRDEDTLMVPIYDMANHSNDPKKLNTLSYKPNEPGDAFRFVATRNILPGEQIYNSYNRCNACSDVNEDDCETFSFYRTPDVFVHFGFVEDYPQNWEFDPDHESSDDDDREFEFCLQKDEEDDDALDAYFDEEDDMPNEDDGRWLRGHLKRLKKLKEAKEGMEKNLVRGEGEEEDEDKMTRWEWDSIWRYHEALVRALDVAAQSVESGEKDEL